MLCVVVAITALLLFGKKASKPKASVDPAKQTVSGSQEPSGTDPAIGSLAPEFSLKSVPDGKTVTLSSLRGKAVVVNFWATWCGPCKIEMPWLVDLQKKYGSQGFQIVGVAMDDADDKEIADFAKKMGVNYVVLKGTEKVGDLYGGIDRLPITYYIDPTGKVVEESIGLVSESTIEDHIKLAMNQAPAKPASSSAASK